MPDEGGKITAFGVTLDRVPSWAVGLAGCVAAVLMLGWGWATWFDRPAAALITQQQANAALEREIAEFRTHIGEAPEREVILRDDVRGRLVDRIYADGCLIPTWTPARGTPRSKLIVDLARDDPDRPPARARGLEALTGARLAAGAQGSACDRVGHGAIVWEGVVGRNACGLLFERRYADGCVHQQWRDTCHGWWGPIVWTVCRH